MTTTRLPQDLPTIVEKYRAMLLRRQSFGYQDSKVRNRELEVLLDQALPVSRTPPELRQTP
jgi:ABC-type microcin C transport system permease subunit YejB